MTSEHRSKTSKKGVERLLSKQTRSTQLSEVGLTNPWKGDPWNAMASRAGTVELWLKRIRMVLCLCLATSQLNISCAQQLPEAPLTTDEVVQKMVERNRERTQTLESYRGNRTYHLEYQGLVSKSATMVVAMTYRQPSEKKFCIVSESGSELLQGRVLRRLIDAEIEATQEEQRERTAMSPRNYEFRSAIGVDPDDSGFYILEVTPRSKNKFLFHGRIWVDRHDFAVARMEGEPAKNPSWWTKRNVIQVSYAKVGEFWLPARNETSTQLRMAGHAVLTIVYQDYEVLRVGAVQFGKPSSETLRCPTKAPSMSEAQR